MLNENYLFLVPALWALGYALKKTPKVPDWSIVWVLFLVSVTLGICTFGVNSEAITQGIVAAGAAVLGHQLIKQGPDPDKKKYIHVAYANSSDGMTGFSTTEIVGKTYVGQYTDQSQTDSTDPSKYNWSLIK